MVDIPFPGGWLIGFAMLFNLLAAHAVRFKLAWNRTGILLIHAGIIVMMFGELITGLFAVEGQMIIQASAPRSTSIVIRSGEDRVCRSSTTIDALEDLTGWISGRRGALLKPGTTRHRRQQRLPFKMEVIQYMVNSDVVGWPRGA